MAIALAVALLIALPASAAAGEPPRSAPLGTIQSPSGVTHFGELDPRTLELRGPGVEMGEYHRAWSFSPDGRSVALGKSAGGPARGIGLLIADTRRRGVSRGIRVPIAVEGLAWVRPRRLIVQLQGNGVWVVNPATGATIARTHAGRSCLVSGPARETADGMVIIGRRHVVAVGVDGRRRVARTGSRPDECDGAGLAVAGGSAWVMARSSRLTEVRLASMRIRDHRLRGPRPAGGRGYTTLIPIGRGRLAAGHASTHSRGKGVEILDTRRDRRLMLDRRAGRVAHGAGRVLVFDGRARIGLTAYRPSGRRAFRALRGWRIENVQVTGRHAYAIAPRRMAIVDLRSGRVVHRARAPRAIDVELLAPR